MGEAKKRAAQLDADIKRRARHWGVPERPTKEDAQAALARVEALLPPLGITDEQDVAVAVALLMSAAVGYRPDEVPPLRFKEPGAATKMEKVEQLAAILRPREGE